MAEIEELIDTAQAAALIGVTRGRITQMLVSGQLKRAIGSGTGRSVYLIRSDVEKFAANRKRTAGRPKKGGEV